MDIRAVEDVFFCFGVRNILYCYSYVLELTTVWVAYAIIAKHAKLTGSSLCARVVLNHFKIKTKLTQQTLLKISTISSP